MQVTLPSTEAQTWDVRAKAYGLRSEREQRRNTVDTMPLGTTKAMRSSSGSYSASEARCGSILLAQAELPRYFCIALGWTMGALDSRDCLLNENSRNSESPRSAGSYCAELAPKEIPLGSSDDDALIDTVAHKLNQLGCAATLKLALEIGELVVRSLFCNDVGVLQLEGKQHPSFRKLAAHPAVPYGAGTIWRSVAIYELSLAAPHLFELQYLAVSHYRAVLHLPLDFQERLLTSASVGRWSKSQLELAVFDLNIRSSKTGRKRVSPALKLIRRIECLFESLRSTCTESLLGDLKAHREYERFAESAKRLRFLCDELSILLDSGDFSEDLMKIRDGC